MNRRIFLSSVAQSALALLFSELSPEVRAIAGQAGPNTSANPAWRGFNLKEKMLLGSKRPFSKWDFETIKEWGFNFVRLPLDYRVWTKKPGNYDQKELNEIDQALGWGRALKIHVNLALYYAPGYCVALPKERSLWADGKEGDASRMEFSAQWKMLADRYKRVLPQDLSFNLVHEPPLIKAGAYYRAVASAVDAIRRLSPLRTVVADDLFDSERRETPMIELRNLKVTQGLHWFPPKKTAQKNQPAVADQLEPWRKLRAQGIDVQVGMWGAGNDMPHNTALSWMSETLKVFGENRWGWALADLRGPMGVLDSDRRDVSYKTYKGHKLDEAMLKLLQQRA